jgi:hypothetical protein
LKFAHIGVRGAPPGAPADELIASRPQSVRPTTTHPQHLNGLVPRVVVEAPRHEDDIERSASALGQQPVGVGCPVRMRRELGLRAAGSRLSSVPKLREPNQANQRQTSMRRLGWCLFLVVLVVAGCSSSRDVTSPSSSTVHGDANSTSTSAPVTTSLGLRGSPTPKRMSAFPLNFGVDLMAIYS